MDESIVFDPSVVTSFGPDAPTDLIGRRQFRRLGVMSFMRSIPSFAAQWSRIPADYWQQDLGPDGYTVAVVACPCGEDARVQVGLSLEHACDRFYFFTGDEVRVANSPRREPVPDAPDLQTPAAS
jgi:hypothetical protein